MVLMFAGHRLIVLLLNEWQKETKYRKTFSRNFSHVCNSFLSIFVTQDLGAEWWYKFSSPSFITHLLIHTVILWSVIHTNQNTMSIFYIQYMHHSCESITKYDVISVFFIPSVILWFSEIIQLVTWLAWLGCDFTKCICYLATWIYLYIY